MNNQLVIQQQLCGLKADFQAVLVDSSISFERECGFATQIICSNDYLLKTAMANQQSLRNAVVNIAALGISLNPAKKQAHLVPRDGKICLDISYIGLIDLAISSGAIRWAHAALVYENDTFTLTGYDTPPEHDFDPFSTERGAIIGVYVVVKISNDEYLTHTLSLSEVYRIRDRSPAWKAWLSKKTTCPWNSDEGEMIKKTVVKQAHKYWPKSERLSQALQYTEHETIDNTPPMASMCPDTLRELLNRVDCANTREQLEQTWAAGIEEIRTAKDSNAYEIFKQAVAERGDEIKALEMPIEGGAAM